ncbi:MAG: TonB-dependent receptor [Bacteroidetes bacterium]|nr:MAG: TonB-dependent receptor [Bacteroidota bacterium]
MKLFSFILIFSTISLPIFAQQHKGDITGKIIDAVTQEPIPSVNIVVVEKSTVGASSDVEGIFKIRALEVGTYSLNVSALGYQPQIVTNVVITTGRATPVMIKLEESAIQVEGVTAEASYFSRAQQMSPVSANVLDRSEVLRSPGGIQDVQRVVQSLPGVASSTDNINELIVRGGAPFENLTILDHMEIPSINHYSNDFNSAGPINMVNADMIEDMQFSSGGFPAQYGDKSSSVMSLTVREGDRNKPFASKTSLNMAGIGTLIEGGFADGNGSYIFSARNSLLEIIDAIMGLSTISLTAIPKYWDTQGKLTYDLSPSQKLSLNMLYGDSRINLEGDPKAKDEERKNMLDSSSVWTMYPVTKQYAVGLSLRSLFGKEGYSMLTLYSSGTSNDMDITEDFAVRQRDANGDAQSYDILNSRKVFFNHSIESFVGAKYELFYQLGEQHSLSTGIQYQTSRKWDNDLYFAPDTARFDLNRDGTYETGPIVIPEGYFFQSIGLGDASKYFIYASDKYMVTPRLSLTLGLRYDHFTYSGKGAFNPRASLSYQLVPATSAITFATGKYSQTQPFPYYGDRRQIGYNRNLEHLDATHYVLGFEHILDRGLKLNIETYYKKYDRSGVGEDFIYSAIDTFWSDRMLAIGERYSYGVEFFLDQKQVEDYFGTLSVSLSKTEMKDPRIPPLTDWFPSEYDYPVVISAIGGKVVKGVRDWLNDAPFYLKYPSYILPFSNEMEISFKYRYQTGRTYTPQEYVTWRQDREGGVHWSNGAWIESDAVNSARYPDYSRLDLQWLSRYYMSGYNINVYFALMNVFNTKNVFFENHRSDGTVETVYQFAFFPVLGVEVEY